ncbi:hypothetical protein STCU_01267 [Strigomonas culicis]|nr:hypothetical protein STCU_01267 [Strigomonas culicis]|eukprot:EPY35066.1 hypothetical protein STCU_01267 [Strigomonas culicis]
MNPGVPRVLSRVTPGKLEAVLISLKERKKRLLYNGSMMQHYNDRMFIYTSLGGPKGTKLVVERHHHRTQYMHLNYGRDKMDIRAVKIRGTQFDGLGGFARAGYALELTTSNFLQTPMLTRFGSFLERDKAIEIAEQWGLDYVILDEIRKPHVEDSLYHRHPLFSHNFHWSPEPPTHHRIGDAEYTWRGDEHIDYKDRNAHSAVPANSFRSLWARRPTAAANKKPAVAAAAPKV